LSAVFKYMGKQAADCRNIYKSKSMAHPHHVWLLKNYTQRMLTYTRILLFVVKYV